MVDEKIAFLSHENGRGQSCSLPSGTCAVAIEKWQRRRSFSRVSRVLSVPKVVARVFWCSFVLDLCTQNRLTCNEPWRSTRTCPNSTKLQPTTCSRHWNRSLKHVPPRGGCWCCREGLFITCCCVQTFPRSLIYPALGQERSCASSTTMQRRSVWCIYFHVPSL